MDPGRHSQCRIRPVPITFWQTQTQTLSLRRKVGLVPITFAQPSKVCSNFSSQTVLQTRMECHHDGPTQAGVAAAGSCSSWLTGSLRSLGRACQSAHRPADRPPAAARHALMIRGDYHWQTVTARGHLGDFTPGTQGASLLRAPGALSESPHLNGYTLNQRHWQLTA